MVHAALHTVSFVKGKMHSDWFKGIEILQGRWLNAGKVRYCYLSGLEKDCKWDMYVPLVTKGLNTPTVEVPTMATVALFYPDIHFRPPQFNTLELIS
jgi:hypothetical protein